MNCWVKIILKNFEKFIENYKSSTSKIMCQSLKSIFRLNDL